MIFFFGSRYYFWTKSQGMFECPKCQTSRQYRYRRGRRFLHLFFIPLIPISAPTEHVRCSECKTRYKPSVLAQPAVA